MTVVYPVCPVCPVLSVCPVCNVDVCGQTVGRIKTKLGMRVGIGPGHSVLDGDQRSLPKGVEPPIFGPYLLWPNGWMDQDTTWCEGRHWLRSQCVTWEPSSPQRDTAPNFWPMSIVANQSSISATAEHLYIKLTSVTLSWKNTLSFSFRTSRSL